MKKLLYAPNSFSAGNLLKLSADGQSAQDADMKPNIHAFKVTKTAADFSDSGLTKTVDLALVPAGSVIRDVKILVTQPGDQLDTLTLSVGVAGDLTRYVLASDALASANTVYPCALTTSDLRVADTTLQATIVGTSLTKVLSDMTQGSWDIYILYEDYS